MIRASDGSKTTIGDSDYLQNGVQIQQQLIELKPNKRSILRCALNIELISICIIFQIEINGI